MRAGPLSDRRVIGVLNRSFVSVYINNQDYDSKGGSAPAEERAELQRIHQEGYAKKLSMGTVRGFMLTPDAHTYDIVTPPMLATPRRTVEHFKPTPGKSVVPPAPQSAPPPASADAVTLHLVSRGDDRGSWAQFPAENWIILQREDWSRILPAGDVEPGQTWEFDRNVSARILTYFYPQTENNNATIDRIQQHLLKAKVRTVKAGMVTDESMDCPHAACLLPRPDGCPTLGSRDRRRAHLYRGSATVSSTGDDSSAARASAVHGGGTDRSTRGEMT